MSNTQAVPAPGEFPDALFRVILTAGITHGLKVTVLQIPAKRTAKVFKTAHGKSIRPESLAVPQTMASQGMIQEFVYVEHESDVEGAIELLKSRARQKATDALKHAQQLHAVANTDGVLTCKSWSAEIA